MLCSVKSIEPSRSIAAGRTLLRAKKVQFRGEGVGTRILFLDVIMYRDTEAQRHKRHRGTEAQIHRGTEAQRHADTEAQRHSEA